MLTIFIISLSFYLFYLLDKGYFIYPALREEQPYIIAQWENGFDQIVKEWT